MPVVRQNSLTLHYLERGAGEPLLLIRGLASSGADWAFQMPALEPHFHLVVPDLPGSGHSPAPCNGYIIADLARSLWALLDSLALPSANIVGFSLGGAVGLEMALQRPESVPRLVLINSLATYRIDHWRKWCEARVPAAMVRVLGMEAMGRLLAGRSFPESWQRPMRERAANVVGAVPAAAYLGMASALEQWDATDRLSRLRSRILVMAGEFDFTPVAEKTALAELLGASLVVVRGSRHGTPFDSITLTNTSLLAHLTDQPQPTSRYWVRDKQPNAAAWRIACGIAAEHAAAGPIPLA